MLRGKQFRQFSEQVKLELAGDGLGHVLAELPATHTPLNSRREIFRHRNADFTSCTSMLDFHSHVANDDVRRIRLRTTVREAQPLKQGTGWTLLSDLEDSQSFNGTPGVVPQCGRCEELAKFSRLMRVERTEKGKRVLHKIIPLLRLDWLRTHEIMLPAVANQTQSSCAQGVRHARRAVGWGHRTHTYPPDQAIQSTGGPVILVGLTVAPAVM